MLLPPMAVDHLRPEHRAWLEAALMDDPRCTLEGTLQSVREERAQLWAILGPGGVRAMLVTWIARYESCSALEVQIIGGEGMADWIGLLSELEQHARNLGCRLVELRGRRGWERVLPDYRMRGICLEKDLT